MLLQPLLYEAAARLLFAPFGGLARIRARVVDACAPRSGSSVLEMGCGPGVLTAALAARGARVVAVDASPAMLQAAVHRVPSASFTLGDARTFVPAIRVDTILISFLMHELPASDWPSVLRRLATGLEPWGRLVIADHATPSTTAGLAWRSVLRRIETRRVDEWLNADLSALVAGAGLTVQEDVLLAGGRVRLMIASR